MPSIHDLFGRFARKTPDELTPAYRKRMESAERRGKPRTAARGHDTTPTPAMQSADLFGSEQYEKSLRVLGRMRAGESLRTAARDEQIRPDTVRRYVGSALERDGQRYTAKAVDRLYRRMEFVTEGGSVAIEPATSNEATKLAKYQNAVRRYLDLGDEVQIRKFAGDQLKLRGGGSLPLVTNLDAIDRLAAAGALSFTSIYRYVA